MSKECTNGQMLDALLENPERKATVVDLKDDNTVMVDSHNNLIWEHNKNSIIFKPFYKDRKWIVSEPNE